jgi:hypothetical protein
MLSKLLLAQLCVRAWNARDLCVGIIVSEFQSELMGAARELFNSHWPSCEVVIGGMAEFEKCEQLYSIQMQYRKVHSSCTYVSH